MDIVLSVVQAVLPSLLVGIIMAHYNGKQNKRTADTNAREQARYAREKVELDLLMATAKLSYATAKAIERGHANGEVEEGVEQYDKAIKKFKDFEREYVSKL